MIRAAATTEPAEADVVSLPSSVRDSTFVVVPAFNEGPALGAVIREIRTIIPNVVVVNDGSRDDTGSIARRCATYTLTHLINRGQGAAIQTGIDFALLKGAAYIITFDADGQHCVEDIPRLLRPILDGECDIAIGSRFLGEATNLPRTRRLVLQAAVLFTRVVNGVRLTDAHNGLRAFSRRAAEKIHIRQDRMAHASEIIDRIKETGLAFKEVPVRIRYTDYSMAKGQSSRGAFRIVFHYLVGKMVD
ncbi:MAG: glycosyltransferase family 2 protein [Phycisphaerales bacterium]|nr:glycosyltransferase family 2 protein [Phycisphaerales bacterium]MCB9857943.1 glycosyltransferase family 2 protein [Phycisphaerales bacterium]